MQGTVLKYFSNYFYVRIETDAEGLLLPEPVLLECMTRNLLKKQGIFVWVGDTVVLDEVNIGNRTARIASVLPRASLLKKPKIANVQRVLVFVPLQQPNLDLRQLDRLLAHVQLSGLTPWILLTKADLLVTHPLDWEAIGYAGLNELVSFYQTTLGVPVFATSIIADCPYFTTMAELAKQLQQTGGKWVLAGVSGAGKSSLLNHLNATFKIKTAAVSDKLERGTHTTRHTELLELFPSVWVADAPGFSHLAFEGIDPEVLQQGFPEFKAVTAVSPCEYPSCLHHTEPHCSVVKAVADGYLSKGRHQQYVDLLKEVTEAYEVTSKQSHKQEVGGVKQGNRKQGGKASAVVRLDPKLREANRKHYNQQLNQLHQTLEVASQEEDAFDDDDL
jgi:ribosome biogenesis GTPase / thiamine phosphate phosphatase